MNTNGDWKLRWSTRKPCLGGTKELKTGKKSGFQDDKHDWEQMEGVSKKCY